MCVKQAENLRIIRSHMDGREHCKANLEFLILSIVQKHLSHLELGMTVPYIQTFGTIGLVTEIGVNASMFPTSPNTFVLGLVLHRKTM